MKTDDLQAWHQRFLQQAVWTEKTRRYVYQKAGLSDIGKVLDIGCGTGALLPDFSNYSQLSLFGLDIDFQRLNYAHDHAGLIRSCCADGNYLPFPASWFDCVLCHYLLLWVPDAGRLLAEAYRVLKPGGKLLCLAEPDYYGRIEYPAEFAQMADQQLDSLIKQGVIPDAGRKLASHCVDSGFHLNEVGLSGGQWMPQQRSKDMEWMTITTDLEGILSSQTLNDLMQKDAEAKKLGIRIQYLPVFFAIATK